jgi:hypothetical protein
MSELFYQNNINKCKGWSNPSSLIFGPQIINLSSYYSPAGSTTLVSISGANFYSYSVVAFGTYNPTIYFVNSNLIQFYVPSTLNAGTFPIQVFNGSIASNIVTYTIDNASGYWLLNSNGSISNTNTTNSALVSVTALSRGVPVTISTSLNPYSVPNNTNWIICDTTGGTIYVTLPSGTQYTGRELTLKNPTGTNSVLSNASSNIIPINSINTFTSTILPSIEGSWLTIIYNGSSWITMQSNFNIPI